jgi:pilus assembly protein Flp/PilA
MPGIKSGVNNMLRKFIQDDLGATAIEYGLIATGIAVAIVVVVFTIGSKLLMTFNQISSAIG